MKLQEKADKIGAQLDELYPAPKPPLDHEDAYTLLIAVLLSAQCTDAQVNKITPGLFALADDAAQMAQLDSETILDAIRSCNLAPTKAKNIAALSRILVDKHEGQVPGTLEELEALPGVGHKTASVVMSQWFGEQTFPVDTHIHRLARRWGLSDGRNVEKTEADLKRLFPEQTWDKRHLQMIYFGREYCRAVGHDMTTCPICSWAASKKQIAYERELEEERRAQRAARRAERLAEQHRQAG